MAGIFFDKNTARFSLLFDLKYKVDDLRFWIYLGRAN